MKTALDKHIEITTGICGGKPRIAGHRIRVMDVVLWSERFGWSPDDIIANYPQLTLADVHAALTYYWDHHDEIRRHIEADERFAEATRHRSTLSQKEEAIKHSPAAVPSGRKRKPGSGRQPAVARS